MEEREGSHSFPNVQTLSRGNWNLASDASICEASGGHLTSLSLWVLFSPTGIMNEHVSCTGAPGAGSPTPF